MSLAKLVKELLKLVQSVGTMQNLTTMFAYALMDLLKTPTQQTAKLVQTLGVESAILMTQTYVPAAMIRWK